MRSSVIRATVIVLIIVSLLVLIEIGAISAILSVPLFLIFISFYTTYTGLIGKKAEDEVSPRHTYYFVWSAVMLSIGSSWMLLEVGVSITMTIVSVLFIALFYVYLNWVKSRS